MSGKLVEDSVKFLESAEEFAGLPKRDLQKVLFRLKKDLYARYEFEVEGFEDDYEARLWTGEEGEDDRAEFVVDRRGGVTEVNAFVVADGEVVVNKVSRY